MTDEEHHQLTKELTDRIMSVDMPVWQFGALMSTMICWWLWHRVPDAMDRVTFIAKITESMCKRFLDPVQDEVDAIIERDKSRLQ